MSNERLTVSGHGRGLRYCRGASRFVMALALGLAVGGCRTTDVARRETPEIKAPMSAMPDKSEKPVLSGQFETDLSDLSLGEAALLALERHGAFRVERLIPELRRAEVDLERAEFDTVMAATVAAGREDIDISGEDAAVSSQTADGRVSSLRAAASLERTLTTGTRLEASGAAERRDGAGRLTGSDGSTTASRYLLSATQPLLRGAGREARTVRLRQARLDVDVSELLLRASAELLVAQVERAAWHMVLSTRRIAIVEESLRLAEAQRDEVEERIRIGRLPEIELAAVEAEVAQRREALINARSAEQRASLELLRLLGSRANGDWTRVIGLRDVPVVPDDELESVETMVMAALAQRPDLEEARLRVVRGDLELVRTRNGMLPRLDAFIALGYAGYADSFAAAHGDADRSERTIDVGLRIEQALGARREQALHRLGVVSRRQAEEALRNMESLVQVEVRVAHLEARRTFDQIAATQATRRLREVAFDAETEKLRVGKSTSLMVAQAQRDLLAARLAEVEAVVQHLVARLDLYRLDGSLLKRRGIALDD